MTPPPRRRTVLLSILVAILLVAPSRCAAAELDNGGSEAAVRVGLPFDYRVGDVSELLGRVGYVWGASAPLTPGIKTDRYLPFSRDYLDAAQGHSLRWWKRNHPGWIVYRCDRRTPAYMFGSTHVPLDLSNPAVRSYQFEAAAGFLREGFGGIAFDNVDVINYEHRCGVWRRGRWHAFGFDQGNRPDSRFRRMVIDWARSMRGMIKRAYPSARISANMMVESWPSPEAGFALARYFDFVMDEQGVTRNARGLLTGDAWLAKLRFLKRLKASGKNFMLLNVAPARHDAGVSDGTVEWSVASYLMVAGRGDYVYVASRGGYGSFYDRPEYHLPLGSASGAFYDDHGVWRRDFGNGLVLANASVEPRTVRLPGAYRDASGTLVTRALTLEPATAAVLLSGP